MPLPDYPVDGQDLMVIAQEVAPGQAFPASAHRSDPLTLKFIGSTPSVTDGTRLTVLYAIDGMHHTLTCLVREWTARGGAAYCSVQTIAHENLDRRRSQRFAVGFEAEFAYVESSDGDASITRRQARASDLSRHGAWVESDVTPLPGALLNLTIAVPQAQPIQVLAVCARASASGFGVSFVDFVGSSKDILEAELKVLSGRAA